ncbi:uncharacterized protein METZ01_LOCUS217951, partial [marine metagenome]
AGLRGAIDCPGLARACQQSRTARDTDEPGRCQGSRIRFPSPGGSLVSGGIVLPGLELPSAGGGRKPAGAGRAGGRGGV